MSPSAASEPVQRQAGPIAEPKLYDDEEPLYHISLNPSKPETIVLLHGVLSCHLEWIFVMPHLSDYHLLVVDLPGHSGSAGLANDPKNLTIAAMADRVASLIRWCAHPRLPLTPNGGNAEGTATRNGNGNGVAHVVGLSMGGFVTIDLARRYPSLCLSAFATGAAPFEGVFAFMGRYPWTVYSIMWLFNHLPDNVYWWMADRTGMKRVDELREEQKKNLKWEVINAVYGNIVRDYSGDKGWEVIRGLDRVRMLNVAGGKQDDLASSGRIKKVWEETGAMRKLGSRVVVVKDAVHAWNLQMPEVFAEGILRWVRGETFLGEFEDL